VIDYEAIAKAGGISKGEPRKRRKAREDRQQADKDAEVRVFVFGRERGMCRCCRIRAAESRHELIPRSLGGKVTKRNCIAVCGSVVGAVPSCHTYLQARAIQWGDDMGAGAQGGLWFTPITREAADWLRINVGAVIESQPMSVYESAE